MREQYTGDPSLVDYLQDDEHWKSYVDLVNPKVQEKLGDRGFLITCTFLEMEREGTITRRGVEKIYSTIMTGDTTPFKTVWKHDWYMDHDMEGPVDL